MITHSTPHHKTIKRKETYMPNYTKKFFPIKDINGHFINKYGDVVKENGNSANILPHVAIDNAIYVSINGKYMLIAKLLLNNFYGDLSLPIIFKDNDYKNLSLDNIEYNISDIELDRDIIYISKTAFKQNPRYHEYYISDSGIVYCDRTKKLNRIRNIRDYPGTTIRYMHNGKYKEKIEKIHRLVYETWVCKITESDVVHHKDEIKYHSYLSNLEKCTGVYNTRESIKSGTKYAPFTIEQVNEICKLYSIGNKPKQICQTLNISNDYIIPIRALIYGIKTGRCYKDLAYIYGLDASQVSAKTVLTEDDVKKIWKMLVDGVSGNKIAKIFGVTPITIYKIRDRERWVSVTDEYQTA